MKFEQGTSIESGEQPSIKEELKLDLSKISIAPPEEAAKLDSPPHHSMSEISVHESAIASSRSDENQVLPAIVSYDHGLSRVEEEPIDTLV
jgi:hypothetical protein